ncbi:MAG: S41 family peptidase [bacterium]
MFKFNKKWIYFPLLFVLFTGFLKSDDDFYFQLSKSIDIFGEVYKLVSTTYVDNINPEELMTAGIDGMLSSLDPYTVFIEKAEKGDIDLITTGKYGGIGATIGIRNDKITILELIEGYSAQRQGIRIGDVVTKINNMELTKENYNSFGKQIKGEPGSTIILSVKRNGVDEELTFSLVREEIEIKNVSYYGFLSESNGIAYIKLSSFSLTAGEEVRKAIIDLRNKTKINSIVLDLRGNPGGLLDAAIDVSEKFLKKGQLVVTVKGRDSLNTKSYYSQEEPIAGDIKLMVLVDNGTASASEIVAGAIQDHDRGVILGTQSFGKGLVQTILSLPYKTSLKITTAKYFTPSGRCIQKIDYSKNNAVLSSEIDFEKAEFLTDSQRKVFSAGGILPDSIVNNDSNSKIINDLLARGIFFNYASYLQNINSLPKNSESDEQIYKEFVSYLQKEKIDFKSNIETSLLDLKNEIKDEKLDSSFTNQIESLLSKSKMLKNSELKKYKNEIVSKIKEEFVLRKEGRNGRIRESLKDDIQIISTINILNNKKLYDHFLYSHN